VTPHPPPPAGTGRNRIVLLLAGFALLAAGFVASVVFAAGWSGAVLSALDRLRGLGWIGCVAFIGVQALVALVGFLPASLLGVAAGAVYGAWLGFVLAASGVMLGAMVAFALARSVLRPAIVRLLDGRAALGRFDAALARDGWRTVVLMRLSPVMPFSLTSYSLGLSAIAFRDYALGTVASLPALLLYVVLGTLGAKGIAAARGGAGTLHLALLGGGCAMVLLLALRTGRLLLRALRPPFRA